MDSLLQLREQCDARVLVNNYSNTDVLELLGLSSHPFNDIFWHVDAATDAIEAALVASVGEMTEILELVDVGCGVDAHPKMIDSATAPESVESKHSITQTDGVVQRSVFIATDTLHLTSRAIDCNIVAETRNYGTSTEVFAPQTSDFAVQTEVFQGKLMHWIFDGCLRCFVEDEHVQPRVLNDSEIADSLWLMPSRDTVDIAVGPDEPITDTANTVQDCARCARQALVFSRNVGVGACSVSDRVSWR